MEAICGRASSRGGGGGGSVRGEGDDDMALQLRTRWRRRRRRAWLHTRRRQGQQPSLGVGGIRCNATTQHTLVPNLTAALQYRLVLLGGDDKFIWSPWPRFPFSTESTGAARWDAERPLGRLIILAHAAFLDAGFVPAGADDDVNSLRLPRQIGRTASALPFRYAAPQLLHRPDAAAAAVKLRLCAHGRNLVFFVSITRTSMFREPWLDTYWVCLDALAAAPLLFSGGLDDTARALRRNARLAALWSALADGLCRRVLADLCTRNGVPLDPTFMSLPGDIKATILARLADDEDLASVECTCAGLRRLVEQQDSTLWKPRYERLLVQLQLPGVLGSDGTMSWKEKYTAAASHGWEQIASMRERRFLQ